ncbi:MAG: hypothetical protein KAI29_09365, partial [Cyclobacteriaceae bacterium]|nr:hypothetical protein [Cyclobacteriaceae bacterium]
KFLCSITPQPWVFTFKKISSFLTKETKWRAISYPFNGADFKCKFKNQPNIIEIPSLPSHANHHGEGMTMSLELKAISMVI